ncbi:MAG: alpha/beta hydrolase [Firmicutes bacterium]|nr:alpha/beta hydrolase [Bacillota bacterium]
MGKYKIHSDFKKYEKIKTPITPALLPLMNGIIATIFNKKKPEKGVREMIEKIPGYQNETIEIRIYEPEDIKEALPCLIYLHGGAFVLKSAAFHKQLICEYALKTPCKVVFVDYRLAPKYAFPVGVEDCFAAFEWVCQNAAAIGIDCSKIAVGGDSAGGALAAAVCLMARDRKAPEICFQMLIYPVTDARQITESVKEFTDTPLWNGIQNQKMWQLYLGEGVHSNKEYASPMEATSLENLPDAYVEVAEFDCLRDEGINFAEALKESGIPVELNQTKGTIHGFEIAESSEIVRQSVIKRVAALKKVFY